MVENAIKHGISKRKSGGEVRIEAKLELENEEIFLKLSVFDSGAGAGQIELAEARQNGLGLNNIEQRLRSYYGQSASLEIKSETGKGTTAEIKIPVADANLLAAETRRHRDVEK